ncbi:MAG TPA: hypothetical protein PKJ97_02380 [Candidatus Bilamarchaeaceae archaeon]|nr:hypothetical protein [Candidatus Bilamarchaeaceae archaeon]
MPKPEETHKTHKEEEPKPAKPKRKVRHPLLAKVGAGLVSVGMLFGSMGRIKADEPATAPPTYVPPQTQYTPVPRSQVESELLPLIESSRQYIRDMEDNKPTRWEVKVSGWQPDDYGDLTLLEVNALLPNGRKVRVGLADVRIDKVTILEIPNAQFGDHPVLALIDPGGTDFFYKDPQTGTFKSGGGSFPTDVRFSRVISETPVVAVNPIDDGPGINFVTVSGDMVQRDSTGRIQSIRVGARVFITSFVPTETNTFGGYLEVVEG